MRMQSIIKLSLLIVIIFAITSFAQSTADKFSDAMHAYHLGHYPDAEKLFNQIIEE
jgi:hypothetical protein